MHGPARELPHEPGVDRAEAELARGGLLGRAADVLEDQRSFVPEKYGSRTRPVFSRTRGSTPRALELVQ